MPRLRTRAAAALAAVSLAFVSLAGGHAVTAEAETSQLEAELSQTEVSQGDQLSVTGTASADGEPQANVSVEVYGGSAQRNLTTVVTDDTGAFSGEFTIPEKAGSDGDFPDYPIIVSIPEGAGIDGSEWATTVTLTEQPAAEPAPSPAETAAPSPSPTEVAAPDEAPAPQITLIPLWMVVVGATGFAALAGLAFIAHRRRPDENARLFR